MLDNGNSDTSISPSGSFLFTSTDGDANDVHSSTSNSSDFSDKATAVGGAVGGVIVGMLLLVAVVIFVTCIVMLKKSRKGSTSTEESSMSTIRALTNL